MRSCAWNSHSHGGNVALNALELLFKGGAEAERGFDELLRALGIERLDAKASADRVVAAFSLTGSLQNFVRRAVISLHILLRLYSAPRVDGRGWTGLDRVDTEHASRALDGGAVQHALEQKCTW